ncbi:MAG: hypothetical protein ACYC7D_10370 [Nitrososphaerales archaeon]
MTTQSTTEIISVKRSGIIADPALMERFDKIAKERGFATRTKTLYHLIADYEASKQSEASVPIATYDNLMRHGNQEPAALIFGLPGSGKSTTLDKFLKEAKHRKQNFLLFSSRARDNSKTEHNWIGETLDYYACSSLAFLTQPGQYLVALETDLDSRRQQVRGISEQLLRLEGDPRLESWVLAFEEGHDYCRLESFKELLRRMRKSTKKIIVIATEKNLFLMCKPFRPEPFSLE